MENCHIEIEKGIHLHHIKTTKFKSTTIAVLIRRELNRDEATKNALIPPLIKRGCTKYPSLTEINIRAEQLYGAVFDSIIIKKGEEQIIQAYLELLEGYDETLLRQGIEFLADILLDPLKQDEGFVEEYADGEKKNLKHVIESRINNKKEYAKLRCLEEMFKNEPFGVYGDGYVEDLDGIDHISLYKHYQDILSNSPIEFLVIGGCTTEELEKHIRDLFDMQKHGICRTEVKEIPIPQINYQPRNPEEISEKTNIAQAKLCMAFKTDFQQSGDEFYELMVLNEVFGGNPESKLFINVREKESICYYANSFVYRFKTVIFAQSGVDESNCKKAIDLISAQMEAIKNGDITDDELEKAKKSLIKKIKGMYDYPQAVMDFYLAERMLSENGTIDSAIESIEKIEKQAVVKSAARVYLDTIFILGGEN